MVSWLITSLRCRGREILRPPFLLSLSPTTSFSWALFPPHVCTPWLTPLQDGRGGLGSRGIGCCDRRVHNQHPHANILYFSALPQSALTHASRARPAITDNLTCIRYNLQACTRDDAITIWL